MSEVGHQTKADQPQEMAITDGLRVLVALTALAALVTARSTYGPVEGLADAITLSRAVENSDEESAVDASALDSERRKRQLWFAAHPLMPYPVQPLAYGPPLHYPLINIYK